MAKGFLAKWAKGRFAAPSNGRVQGCALHTFVMQRSIDNFAAAQQAMVLTFDIDQNFSAGGACSEKIRRWRDGTNLLLLTADKPNHT